MSEAPTIYDAEMATYVAQGITTGTIEDRRRQFYLDYIPPIVTVDPTTLTNDDLELLMLQSILPLEGGIDTSTATKTASTVYGTHTAAKAFDGDMSTFWWSQPNAPQWLQVQFTSPQVVRSWALYFNDASFITGTVDASNDGTHWTTLDTFTNISQYRWTGNSFDNDTAYTYYRLNITYSDVYWIKVFEWVLFSGKDNNMRRSADEWWYYILSTMFNTNSATLDDLKYAFYTMI